LDFAKIWRGMKSVVFLCRCMHLVSRRQPVEGWCVDKWMKLNVPTFGHQEFNVSTITR
jgi:hypothetical protein